MRALVDPHHLAPIYHPWLDMFTFRNLWALWAIKTRCRWSDFVAPQRFYF